MSSATASSSKKRIAESDSQLEVASAKKAKVHPLFANATPDSSFKWQRSLGPEGKRTCLHGTNLESRIVYNTKIAAFDLDDTLIESSFGKGSKKSTAGHPYQWWNKDVSTKLEKVFNAGYSIVIFSNQATKQIEEWKKKISLIANALPGVPFRIMAATKKDGFRKPMPGMWHALEDVYRAQGVEIDKSSSFFVGDAAARKNDFSGSDRKWALNVDIPFLTPEEYFLGKTALPFDLSGFNVSSLGEASPTIPLLSKTPEIALFVGFPCLGKSSFYRKHFGPAGYIHINQDTLKSRDKCIKAAEEASKSGKSCVIDNTNRDVKTRQFYIDLGKKYQVPVRCFKFEGSMQLAWHNNLYRAFTLPLTLADREPKREAIPYVVFTSYQTNYEAPEVTEGLSEVVSVAWVFEGTDEDRKRWSMWHQIDGK